MKLYLSGAMSGIEDYNFPAFNSAAKFLRLNGDEVFNPAESFNGKTDLSYTDYLREDIRALLDVDGVRVLDGWETSVGARIEVMIALALGLEVKSVDGQPIFEAQSNNRDALSLFLGMSEEAPINETILEEAQRLVHGDRGKDYGNPYDDFSKTALIWTAILGKEIKPADVALCMVGVKISREVNKPKRDNRVDGAGYFETLDMVREREEEIAMEGQRWLTTFYQ